MQSGFDYLIMLDDDCILEGKPEDGQRFLRILAANPGKYLKKDNEFKLFAISRSLYEKYPLPPLEVEKGTGIEDFAFFTMLKSLAPKDEIKGFNWGGLKDASVWANDRTTSWDRSNFLQLFRNTQKYLAETLKKQQKNLK